MREGVVSDVISPFDVETNNFTSFQIVGDDLEARKLFVRQKQNDFLHRVAKKIY